MSDPTAAAPAEPQPQEFAAFLMEHLGGATHDELTAHLAAIVKALRDCDSGKPVAKLQLTFTFRRDVRKGQELTLSVTDDIKVQTPKAERAVQTFYMTEQDRLSLHHPAQRSMFEVTPVNRIPTSGGGA